MTKAMTKDRVIASSAVLALIGGILVAVQISVFVCALVVGAGLSGLAWGNSMGRVDEIKRHNARMLAVIVTFVALDAIVGAYLVGRPDGNGALIFPSSGISLALRTRIRHGGFYAVYLYSNLFLFAIVAVGAAGRLTRASLGVRGRGGVRRTDRYDVVGKYDRY